MRAVTRILRYGVSIAIVYFIVYTITSGYDELRQYEFNFELPLLALSLVVLMSSFALPVWIWLFLMRSQGAKKLTPFSAWRIWFYSLMGRYIPGKVALVALRAGLAKQHGIAPPLTVSVAVVEVLFAITASILFSLPLQIKYYPELLLPTLGVCAATSISLLSIGSKELLSRINRIMPPSVKIMPLRLPARVWLICISAYLAYWTVTGAALYLFLASFLSTQRVVFLFVAPSYSLAYVGGLLAVFVPAGIGVREVAFASLLQILLDQEIAYMSAVAVRLWSTLTEILVFLVIASIKRLFAPALDVPSQ